MPTVLKRDGTSTTYNPDKIISVLTAAGLEPNQTDILISHINTWILGQKEPVSTLTIRDEVIKKLEILNPYVAGLFKWYQKTKDSSISV